nr:MAG TPA: hypothetical protein [Caudoviricetes sp.]
MLLITSARLYFQRSLFMMTVGFLKYLIKFFIVFPFVLVSV